MKTRIRQTHRPAESDADLYVYPAFVPISHAVHDEASDAAAAKAAADADAAATAAAAATKAAAGGYKPPSSQAELDQMIESRLARERAAHRRELDVARGTSTADAASLAELETLRKEKTDRDRKAEEAKGNYDRALDSVRKEFETEKEKIAREKEDLLKELRQTRCSDALVAASSDAGAINARQVARLLDPNVKLDDTRKVVILDDDGNPWLKGGKNISITDLLEKFAHDNPHLFKAKQAAGAGAGAKGGADTSDTGDGGVDEAIVAAQKVYDEAHKQADRTGSDADITQARLALRELSRLQMEKKAKKGAAA